MLSSEKWVGGLEGGGGESEGGSRERGQEVREC